jgi:hypothetical protein
VVSQGKGRGTEVHMVFALPSDPRPVA